MESTQLNRLWKWNRGYLASIKFTNLNVPSPRTASPRVKTPKSKQYSTPLATNYSLCPSIVYDLSTFYDLSFIKLSLLNIGLNGRNEECFETKYNHDNSLSTHLDSLSVCSPQTCKHLRRIICMLVIIGIALSAIKCLIIKSYETEGWVFIFLLFILFVTLSIRCSCFSFELPLYWSFRLLLHLLIPFSQHMRC